MHCFRWSATLAAVSLVLGVGEAGTAWSKDNGVWPVDNLLVGVGGKKSEDVSGIACTTSLGFPRQCLVIDDDLQAAQFVTVEDGELKAGDVVPLISDSHDGQPLELDGEGVAYFEGAFYVIGSHGHPRRSSGPEEKTRAKIAAVSQIVRIELRSSVGDRLSRKDIHGISRSRKLRELMAGQPLLTKFMDQPLKDNGATIEGVAILDGRLFAGFRGPWVEHRGAPVLSVRLTALFGDDPPDSRLRFLPIGDGRGIRDLAAYGGGILILAGPTLDEAGRYEVFWWDGVGEKVTSLGDITEEVHADRDQKPEAILPLDTSVSGLRLLVLSDGKEAKEGKPRTVVVRVP